MKKNIAIIGYGRFGQVLEKLLKDKDFQLTVIEPDQGKYPPAKNRQPNVLFSDDSSLIAKTDTVFYAVPISLFEEIIKSHLPHLTNQLIIDVLSVKLHPAKVIKEILEQKPKLSALLTHPMFGPDSIQADGVFNQPMIIDSQFAAKEDYIFWKEFFAGLQLRVIEMSCDEHDRLAARSQGLTHFIGRMLDEFDLQSTPIDSLGAKKLQAVKQQTCNDTWQLFTDLQTKNPYTKKMRLDVGAAFDRLYNRLLPEQVDPKAPTFGIQGGKGSFNEEALDDFLERNKIKKYHVKYLYTSTNVLRELYEGTIDYGQFAIHNSLGGIVAESIATIADYKFEIVEEFAIKISHTLMTKPEVDFNKVTTIMTHPQVFKQCKANLEKYYPDLEQKSGKGELIDHAKVAEALAKGELPDNVATIGSAVLADIYNLKIIKHDLQDYKENYTSFLLIKRKLS